MREKNLGPNRPRKSAFSYLAVGRVYFSERRSLLRLLFIVVVLYGPLRLRVLEISRRTAVRLVMRWCQSRLGRLESERISLPKNGDICIRVHRGFKLFDFHAKTVTRFFHPDVVDELVIAEITAAETAANLLFAPKVLRADRKERFYTEEYVRGDLGYATSAGRRGTFIPEHNEEIVSCLRDLLLLKPRRSVPLSTHLNSIMETLPLQRMCDSGVVDEKIEEIRQFMEEITASAMAVDHPVDLVFSHGDFSLVNFIETPTGLCVIDWEGAAYRTVLFDLHNLFMTELYYKRARDSVVSEVNQMIDALASKLQDDGSRAAKSLLSSRETLRKTYYAERISMLLSRELSNHLIGVVLRSILVFRDYETMAGGI